MRFRREEYVDIMTFGGVPRQMFVELFGPLVGLELEWRTQGASRDELDLVAFDWDFVPVVGCGGSTGVFRGSPVQTLEETSEYVMQRDELGRTVKMCKGMSTIPLPLDYPVSDFESWLRVRPLFEFCEDRIDWDQVELARRSRAGGALVVARIPGGFDIARELMGAECACLSYHLQPDLMHDILDTIAGTSVEVLERVTNVLTVDQLSVHEDMAGKSGPLIGPKLLREFVKPYYSRVWDLMSSRGTRLFDVDSDGNVDAVLATFIECGVNSFLPMEPAAGMDIVAVRKEYGQRLAMRGGIDKFVLKQGKEAIRRELEHKMQPLMQEGGMVFGLDHRIPNGTPLEGYRTYVKLGRELLNLPRLDGTHHGWRRMAF